MKINGIFVAIQSNIIKIMLIKIYLIINKDLQVNKIITCINNGTHYLGLSTAAQAFKIPVHAVYTFDKRAKSISIWFFGKDKIKDMIKINRGRLINK